MSLTYNALLQRERLVSEQVPYTVHLSDRVLRTGEGDYLQAFRLGGASFESVDDVQLNNWHERLNILWRNIASPDIALWAHVIRRREVMSEVCKGGPGFADSLHSKYQHWLGSERLMVNELYLSVLYRPMNSAGGGMLARILSRGAYRHPDVQDALDVCDKLAKLIEASLARYDAQPLGMYMFEGRSHSSLLEFLGLLLNGERERFALIPGAVAGYLPVARLIFGAEAMEYRLPTGTRVGGFLGIREYATPSLTGFYNRLLSAPFSFVLTQSFVFISKAAAQGLLQRQIYRMANAGDFGVTQAAQLGTALDALTGNEFVMGDHHFSLQIMTDVDENVAAPIEQRLKPLNDQIARARAMLADTGMAVAREDLAMEAAFWAQLPGNFPLRPRRAPVTSRNFAAMSAFHNYPAGRLRDNHWGEALATFTTSARSPYHFSLHASDAADPGSRRDTGHTFICGPTGCGKTVLVGFLIAMLARRDATQIVFDKDRGLEILVRALGGKYFSLHAGTPTGLNPLQLAGKHADLEFLKSWLGALAGESQTRPLSDRESNELVQALHATLALSPSSRRLSRLIEFLDPTDSTGLYGRLARWCASRGGDYAWLFDNPRDSISDSLGNCPTVGFDVTEFLDNAQLRTPITLYLFHLVRQCLDGRKLVCWMDEFWKLLADEAFAAFAKNGPKTWRKLNAVMCLATQSPSDVLQSSISRTIVEQTATKIFFPNADANEVDYTEGFGLTEREFRLIRERLEPGSRSFLIKQGHQSVVAQLDLRGFDAELRVISGKASELERMSSLMQRYGSDVGSWLEAFLNQTGPLEAKPAPLAGSALV